MALPNRITVNTSYSEFESADPKRRFPGQRVDADFAALRDGINNTIDALSTVMQDQGVLRDRIVGRDAFAPGVGPTFGRPVAFALGSTYPQGSTVLHKGRFYYALRRVENAASEPSAGADWEMIGDFRSGLVVSEDNLAGITDPAAARAALGLGSMAVEDSGVGPHEFRNNGQNDQRFLRAANNLSDLADPEAALDNLGLSGAAVSNLITDLNVPAPGIIGRAASGEGPVQMLSPGGILGFSVVGGQASLTARRATLAEAESGADVPAYLNPFLAKRTFDRVLNSVVGETVFPNGPLLLRADRMLHLRHEVATGAAGGALTTGDWRTRPLNWIESSGIPGAALSASRFELPGGLYFVSGVVQSYNVGRVRTRLQRVEYTEAPAYATNAADDTLALSVSESLAGSASGRNQMTQIEGMFSTSRRSRFEIQQQVSTTGTMGQAASFGGYRECYLDLFIFRLGDASQSAPYQPPVYLGT